MDDFKLKIENNPHQADLKFLDDNIFEYNFSKIGRYSYEDLVIFIRDKNKVVAGLYGYTGLGWLYIHLLWVKAEHRSKGLGTRLIEAAELEAINRGCHGVYLYTYSFQKPVFYEKRGYQVFAQLENFPDSYLKFFMKKALAK